MKTHVIKIGSECNNRCYFCKGGRGRMHRDGVSVLKEIHRARERGCDSILFAGVEPAIHAEFPGFIAAAKKAGMRKISVVTNARIFCYADFAEKCAELKLTGARVIVPDCTGEGYGEITGAAEGFAQFEAGVKNLHAAGIDVEALVPVCGKNHRRPAEIVGYIASIGIRKIEAVVPEEYFFEGEEFDAAELEKQIAAAEKRSAAAGADFLFDRSSKVFRSVCEMEERTSPCFYPTFYVGRKRHPEVLEALLRPTFACNQICSFCWVDTSLRKPASEKIFSEIKYIIRKRIPKLGISGGEPTLDAQLARYIEAAKSGGVRQVELHTNAVRLADAALCGELRDAGLDVAFCTLLAPDAKTSDAITRTGGTFRKSVAGILNLLTQPVNAVAHCVIMAENYRLLPRLVRFVDETFSYGGGKMPITFSFVAPRDMKAMREGIVPRFTDVAPYLREAIEECEARGLPYCAGEGLKGVPHCAAPMRERYMRQSHPSPGNFSGGAFVKKAECATCVFDGVCFGVRRHYAEYYGMDEIKPVSR